MALRGNLFNAGDTAKAECIIGTDRMHWSGRCHKAKDTRRPLPWLWWRETSVRPFGSGVETADQITCASDGKSAPGVFGRLCHRSPGCSQADMAHTLAA